MMSAVGTHPCNRQFGDNKCQLGDSCNFASIPDNVCVYFLKGRCNRAQCKWQHQLPGGQKPPALPTRNFDHKAQNTVIVANEIFVKLYVGERAEKDRAKDLATIVTVPLRDLPPQSKLPNKSRQENVVRKWKVQFGVWLLDPSALGKEGIPELLEEVNRKKEKGSSFFFSTFFSVDFGDCTRIVSALKSLRYKVVDRSIQSLVTIREGSAEKSLLVSLEGEVDEVILRKQVVGDFHFPVVLETEPLGMRIHVEDEVRGDAKSEHKLQVLQKDSLPGRRCQLATADGAKKITYERHRRTTLLTCPNSDDDEIAVRVTEVIEVFEGNDRPMTTELSITYDGNADIFEKLSKIALQLRSNLCGNRQVRQSIEQKLRIA